MVEWKQPDLQCPAPLESKLKKRRIQQRMGAQACHCSLLATTIYFEERSVCGENGLLVPSASKHYQVFSTHHNWMNTRTNTQARIRSASPDRVSNLAIVHVPPPHHQMYRLEARHAAVLKGLHASTVFYDGYMGYVGAMD